MTEEVLRETVIHGGGSLKIVDETFNIARGTPGNPGLIEWSLKNESNQATFPPDTSKAC